ncbi:hypothetical protein BR93DRAFT_27801 [Coniochaeta sp. PMI_546]|nr:hypothetical protein BR93DRAFT_27801 [Coniochaeta sp. PMI_546]
MRSDMMPRSSETPRPVVEDAVLRQKVRNLFLSRSHHRIPASLHYPCRRSVRGAHRVTTILFQPLHNMSALDLGTSCHGGFLGSSAFSLLLGFCL